MKSLDNLLHSFETWKVSSLGIWREFHHINLQLGDVLIFLEGHVTYSFNLEMIWVFFGPKNYIDKIVSLDWKSLYDNSDQISFRDCREVHRISLQLGDDLNFPEGHVTYSFNLEMIWVFFGPGGLTHPSVFNLTMIERSLLQIVNCSLIDWRDIEIEWILFMPRIFPLPYYQKNDL